MTKHLIIYESCRLLIRIRVKLKWIVALELTYLSNCYDDIYNTGYCLLLNDRSSSLQ